MEKDPTRDLETMNLKNLTIGVFAIVMTLLVLDAFGRGLMLINILINRIGLSRC